MSKMVYVFIRLFIEVLFVIIEGWKLFKCLLGRDSYIKVGVLSIVMLYSFFFKKKKGSEKKRIRKFFVY